MIHKTYFLIALSLLLACGEPPNPHEIERNTLYSFIKFDAERYVKPTYIEETLYDIQSSTDTMGRAFRITKYLFLTNYHVIAPVLVSNKYAQLIKQAKRGFLQDREGEFTVIFHDKAKDIALLRIKKRAEKSSQEIFSPKGFWGNIENYWKVLKSKTQQFFSEQSNKEEVVPENKVYYHLYDRVLKEKLKISQFLRFDGEKIKHKGYRLKFGGFDLYDKSKYVSYMGEFVLPPNSSLYEKKGYVLPFQQEKIAILTKTLPSSSKKEIITSIPVYQGESGSPVFLENKKSQYYLAGITTKTLSVGDTISTPGHPLGVLAYERTVSFIVHRDTIFEFIQDYLEKSKNKIDGQNLPK